MSFRLHSTRLGKSDMVLMPYHVKRATEVLFRDRRVWPFVPQPSPFESAGYLVHEISGALPRVRRQCAGSPCRQALRSPAMTRPGPCAGGARGRRCRRRHASGSLRFLLRPFRSGELRRVLVSGDAQAKSALREAPFKFRCQVAKILPSFDPRSLIPLQEVQPDAPLLDGTEEHRIENHGRRNDATSNPVFGEPARLGRVSRHRGRALKASRGAVHCQVRKNALLTPSSMPAEVAGALPLSAG